MHRTALPRCPPNCTLPFKALASSHSPPLEPEASSRFPPPPPSSPSLAVRWTGCPFLACASERTACGVSLMEWPEKGESKMKQKVSFTSVWIKWRRCGRGNELSCVVCCGLPRSCGEGSTRLDRYRSTDQAEAEAFLTSSTRPRDGLRWKDTRGVSVGRRGCEEGETTGGRRTFFFSGLGCRMNKPGSLACKARRSRRQKRCQHILAARRRISGC